MSRDEVIALLRGGKILRQTGTLSLQSKFESGEVVSHQVMQSLVYGDLVKLTDDLASGSVWMLRIC